MHNGVDPMRLAAAKANQLHAQKQAAQQAMATHFAFIRSQVMASVYTGDMDDAERIADEILSRNGFTREPK